MAATIAQFAPGVEALSTALPKLLDAGERARVDAAIARGTAQGVPPELAARVVTFDTLYAALDIVEEAATTQRPVETVARIYFELATRLGLPWLREKIAALPGRPPLADAGARRDAGRPVGTAARDHARCAGRRRRGDRAAARRGLAGRQPPRDRARGQLLAELRSAPAPDAAMLSVALRELRNLAMR